MMELEKAAFGPASVRTDECTAGAASRGDSLRHELLAAEAHLGHHPLSEFAFIFVPVMTVPFAFVLAAVYLPATLLVRRRVRDGRSWIVAAAGGAAAPLAGLALLAAGRLLLSGSPHMRPAMWDDVIALSRDPMHTLPYALALLAGGIVFGATIGRARLSDAARFVQR
jgi:hypothetical protein